MNTIKMRHDTIHSLSIGGTPYSAGDDGVFEIAPEHEAAAAEIGLTHAPAPVAAKPKK